VTSRLCLNSYFAPSIFTFHFPQQSVNTRHNVGTLSPNTPRTTSKSMLSYRDRGKFEQLRARWEATEPGEDKNMVGRREKPLPQQASEDPQHNTGSKFWRKLSYGLALISLTQRKDVPRRQPSSNASLAVSAPSMNDSATATLHYDTLLSTSTDAVSTELCGDPPTPLISVPKRDSARASEDLNQTLIQLPRSRTFSYIPRLVKGPEGVIDPSLDTAMTDARPYAPFRIPTPSLPMSQHRGSSPCQYLPPHTPLQARKPANRQSFTNISNGSPSKAAVRSRTTPNLVKAANASYMAPRKPGLKRPLASSTSQKSVLAENVPTNKRVSQRVSQIQDQAVKRESLSVASASSHRRSFVPGVPHVQSKHLSLATPSISPKRFSAHLAQTPVTARRIPTNRQEDSCVRDSPRLSEGTSIAQPRLMGLKIPPAPTFSTVERTDPLLAQPRLTVDSDVQRKTLGTPNGLGGVWRTSKVFATANHQVRRLPRSSTFHNFGRCWEAAPPMPSIPQQYESPSTFNLIRPVPQQHTSPSLSNLHHRFAMSSGKFGSSSRSLLSEIASAQTSSEVESMKSSSEFVSVTISEIADNIERRRRIDDTDEEQELFPTQSAGSTSEPRPYYAPFRSQESSTSSSNVAKPPPTAMVHHSRPIKTSISLAELEKTTRDLQSQRRWSISESFYPNSANDAICVQVKDYMPPLYWAGRFQSRFDQWRTEAMVAVLDPANKPEDKRPLGQCSLDDDKKATVLIFMQLRDLCASAHAADSLQVH
jgi:hypothetical protein